MSRVLHKHSRITFLYLFTNEKIYNPIKYTKKIIINVYNMYDVEIIVF